MRIGYCLSSEESDPRELVRQARMAEEAVPCGLDLDLHLQAIRRYEGAGFDELYIQQISHDHERFFETYAREILPQFHTGPQQPQLSTVGGH